MSIVSGQNLFGRFMAVLAAASALAVPHGAARADEVGTLQSAFDSALGTSERAPRTYANPFEARIAALASADQGRIGVAAFDLSSGRSIDVLGSQPFPMASTSKIAIAATFFVPGLRNIALMLVALGIGAAAAWFSGKKVKMTDMPQMVAIYNGMGGGAAAAIAAIEFARGDTHSVVATTLAVLGALIGSV